jgi:very-short-patch-repair endonuclease
MGGKRANRGPDRAIAAIAARQHGVLSLTQLMNAGATPRSVERRVQAGRLHRLHRGVYAVGHQALTHRGRWLAAVLACGEGAVLSHTDGAALWLLLPPAEHPGPVHVSVPGTGGRRRRSGIVLHRSSTLAPAEAPSRSRLERRFLALCRRHGLPAPEVNVFVGRERVDFLWRQERLVVEADGWGTHRTRAAFEANRARDARLKLLGYEVVRFTDRQVREEPARVAATLRALLRRPTPAATAARPGT